MSRRRACVPAASRSTLDAGASRRHASPGAALAAAVSAGGGRGGDGDPIF